MKKKTLLILGLACACLTLPAYSDGGGSAGGKPRSSEYKAAVKAIKGKDYAAAVELLEEVVEAEPDNADAWNHMGFSLRNLRQFDDALAAYEKALDIEPKHKGALEYKGELFLTLGNLEGAEEMFDRLNSACFLSCKEKKQLAAAIRAYKKAN